MRLLALMILAPLWLGCRESSGALTPAQRERFAAEGVRREAQDLVFRYTEAPGRRRSRCTCPFVQIRCSGFRWRATRRPVPAGCDDFRAASRVDDQEGG